MTRLTFSGRINDKIKKQNIAFPVEVRHCYATAVYAMQTATPYDRVVVAKKRHGCKKGGLHFTMQLNRSIDQTQASQYIVLTAMAIQQTLFDYEIKSKVKWPNTVTVMNKKIADISVTFKSVKDNKNIVFLTVSMGVKEEPGDNETTLTRQAVMATREEVLAKILKNFIKVEKDYYEKVVDSYRKISNAVGKTIIADGKQGKAIGLSEDGYLLVDFGDKIDKVTTEDVEIKEG